MNYTQCADNTQESRLYTPESDVSNKWESF